MSQSSDSTIDVDNSKKDSAMERLLKSIDIYGEPIRLHDNGKVRQTSKTGGGFSILSILFLLLMIGNITYNSVKDVNKYVENLEEQHSRRLLQEEDTVAEDPPTEEEDTEVGSNNKPKNFHWKSSMEEEITVQQRNASYSAADFGISKIEIILNQASLQENINEDVSERQAYESAAKVVGDGPKYKLPYINGPYWQVKRNDSAAILKKNFFQEQLKYIKYEVDIREFKAIPIDGNGLQIEGGELESESFQEKIPLTFEDIDWSDPLMPRFDITKHVRVLGDYFANASLV